MIWQPAMLQRKERAASVDRAPTSITPNYRTSADTEAGRTHGVGGVDGKRSSANEASEWNVILRAQTDRSDW